MIGGGACMQPGCVRMADPCHHCVAQFAPQAPVLFESCIVLLTSTLNSLHEELARREAGFYQVRMRV